MGVGFIVGGFCPGTSLVSAAVLKLDGIFFALGVFFGIFLFGETIGLYEGFWHSSHLGRFTLDEWLNLPLGVVVLLIVVMALLMFWGGEKLESIYGGRSLAGEPRWRYAAAGALVIGAAAVVWIGQPTTDDRWQMIESTEAPRLFNREVQIHPAELLAVAHDSSLNLVMLDMRSEADYNLFHILDAHHVGSLEALQQLVPSLLEEPANTVFVVMSNDEAAASEAWKLLRANSPFDAPLASRFNENDAVIVFENCFVPWENVLIFRDVEKTRQFYAASGFFNRFNLQSAVRLAIKLEFCIGLLIKGTEASGTDQFRGVQAAIGELVAMRETFAAFTTAMVCDPEPGIGRSVVPRLQTAAACRIYTTNAWTQVRETFETVLAGAPSFTISGVNDMHAPELTDIIDTYYQGTNLAGRDRVKLFNLVWDALYSEFGGRHGLYERNYAGNKEQQRLDALRWATLPGDVDRCRGLVERCLAD